MRSYQQKPQTLTGTEQKQGSNLKALRMIVQSFGLCCGRNQEIQKISNISSNPTHT